MAREKREWWRESSTRSTQITARTRSALSAMDQSPQRIRCLSNITQTVYLRMFNVRLRAPQHAQRTIGARIEMNHGGREGCLPSLLKSAFSSCERSLIFQYDWFLLLILCWI